MAAKHWLSAYFDDIADIAKSKAAGGYTEGSYRTPIENMLKAAADEFGTSADILQEPGRIKSIGAPDFLISAKSGGVIGYVECKQPGADLHKETTKAQVERYRALSENILLTDSFRWMHLREGKIAADVQLTTKPDKRKRDDMTALLRAFMTADAGRIDNAKALAASLAYRCAILQKGLLKHKGGKESSRLQNLLQEFKKALDRDLDYERFADVFAQTLVYSLLMAKLNAPDGTTLELDTVRRHIPENFAVIRQITTFLPDIDDSVYKGIRWIVSDILAAINGMDKVAIAESMSYKRKSVSIDGDPYINFYEDFLAEYDPKLRKSRGVYYTPQEVVRFIVRAANDLLRRDFNMPEGLANEEKVIALDFAAGTGTFMMEMAKLLFAGRSEAKKNMLAHEHFLQNFYGFEMMTSAYVISHLKLSRYLADNSIDLQNDERIKVYLANTLERIDKQLELKLIPALADEVQSADKIKDSPVLVIVGNPPYSIASQNKGKWIVDLLRGINDGKKVGGSYYEIDGNPLGEKNPKALQDDYVKFIRFAQHKMDQVPRGIVAIITNHGFLDNLTFRGMRQSLMKTFDALYLLDLHGNSNKKEKAPDGGKDENVFDIRQGVAISLLVKNPTAKQKGVFHADLWGTRKHKYATCAAGDAASVKWATLKPKTPNYYFVPNGSNGNGEDYDNGYSVRDIFAAQSSGIITARDSLTIAFSEAEIQERIRKFVSIAPEEARQQFNLPPDTRDWRVNLAQKDFLDNGGDFYPIAYRPFDSRHTYYTGRSRGFHCMPRGQVMRQMVGGNNLGLVAVRQVAENCFNHVFIADKIMESRMTTSNKGYAYLFPLYLYENGMGAMERHENFTADFRRWIDDRYGVKHTPESILGCIYAVLHSPNYRTHYAKFLRRDFPRIQFPESNDEFKRLTTIGGELMAAHLLQKNCDGELGELGGNGTSHEVIKVRYDEKSRLYFNKDEYFNIPPEVFNFQIGGYKPLDKYLKSRKGLKLSITDIRTIKKAANAINFTIKQTGEIDK